MLERKRWKDLAGPSQSHHLAIILFLPQRQSLLHTHDFPEIFWIERGQGFHEINGETKQVRAGDLIFIQPEDRHRLRAIDPRGFAMVNLAFDPRVRAGLLRRHREAFAPLLARTADTLPHRARLGPAQIAGLRKQLAPLAAPGPSRLALEHFLLGLPLLLQPSVSAELPAMPDWLQRACEQVQRPELFALGAPGLVKASSRSAEHVARTVRAVFGLTPSDYVNRVRMEHAARELRITNRPIADIALECGLANLSHFYALFRAAHGRTPRAYRLEHQSAVA
ncbi:MAG: AraC family transcriptional regulator [Opitutaceae bacterium]